MKKRLETAPTEFGAALPVPEAPAQGPAFSHDALAKATIVGRYKIDSVIGSGGMGMVYAAHDTELERRVAIKVLHPEVSTALRADSLLDEARTMAKLSHPNVCTVYEAGMTAVDHRLFLAMEYIDGETLTAWLAQPRRWREILEVMIAAGRGLEAAHRAGILHRDFKPDNIMIGRDHHVRVMDFGIAGNLVVSVSEDPSPSGSVQDGSPHQLVGTPGFMAPEQFHLAPLDARSDQFAFAVSCYHALYGVAPYTGNTLISRIAGFEQGIREPPAGVRIPRWLRAIVVRGLSPDPAHRFESMTAMLDELERAQQRRRNIRTAFAACGLLAVGGGIAAFIFGRDSAPAKPERCGGADARMAGTWGPAQRSAIENAFLATGVPIAAAEAKRVATAFDDVSKEWTTTHRDACEATWVRGEQSQEMLDRRMFCLDQRRDEIAALVRELETPDRATVVRGAQSVHSLDRPSNCVARASLLSVVGEPADPTKRTELAAARRSLAEVKARLETGRYREALTAGDTLTQRATQIGHAPLTADVLLQVGILHGKLGEFAAGEKALVQSVRMAEDSRDDYLKARALVELAYYVGYERADVEHGRQWADLAEASLDRAGGDPNLAARLLGFRGMIAFVAGEPQEALTIEQKAVAQRVSTLGSDHPEVIEALTSLGGTAIKLGKVDEGLTYLVQALAAAQNVFGPEHPEVAELLNNVGGGYAAKGEADKARDFYQRALDIWERALGPNHPDVAIALSNLGALALDRGDPDEAITRFQGALGIEEAVLGKDHPWSAVTLTNLGMAYEAKHDYPAALVPLERTVKILDGQHTLDNAQAQYALARVLLASGQRARALRLARAAREILAAAGPDAAATLTELDAWVANAG